MKADVKEKISKNVVLCRLRAVMVSAFDVAMAAECKEMEEKPFLDMDLDAFSPFLHDTDLAKLQKLFAVMQDVVNLNAWEEIAKSTNVDILNAAGSDQFEKWQRINIKKVETWGINCLPLCTQLLESFAEKVAKVSLACFDLNNQVMSPIALL